MLLAAVLTVSVVPSLLEQAPLDRGTFAALAAGTYVEPGAATAAAPTNPLTWFVGLIPENPFEALAEGRILSILIVVVLFSPSAGAERAVEFGA